MTVRIAQFVHAASDVVDEAFLRDFPMSRRQRPTASNPWSMRSTGRKSFTSTIQLSPPSSRGWCGTRDKPTSGSSSPPFAAADDHSFLQLRKGVVTI